MNARQSDLALQDYIDILARRWKIIIAVLVLALVGAVAATLLRPTVYEARSEVLIRTGATNQLFPSASTVGNRIMRQSQAEITYLRTDAYRAAASDRLGRNADVNISLVVDPNVGDSGRIEFRSTDGVAANAAEAAQTYAEAYIEARNRDDIEDLERQLSEATASESALSAELAALRGPLDAVDFEIARTIDPVVLDALRIQRNQLASELGGDIGRVQGQLTQAENSVAQLTEALSIIQDPDMTAVVSRAAQTPTEPISNTWVRNLLVALAVGAVLGLGAALMREALDSRLNSEDELTRLTNLPVLGHVSRMDKRDQAVGLIVNQREPNQLALEAYRKIRSSIMFLRGDQEIQVIQVTSPQQGNGKTTVATNLAVAFAQQGLSVMVIDADMRRPQVHKRFLVTGMDNGLSSVLNEELPYPEASRLDTATGVHILPAGERPPNPSELLGSDAFRRLYKMVRADFDIVVIDSPPVLPVPDSRLVASIADAVVLVTDTQQNTAKELKHTVDQLETAGANLAGMVLNRVPEGKGYGYNYEYDY